MIEWENHFGSADVTLNLRTLRASTCLKVCWGKVCIIKYFQFIKGYALFWKIYIIKIYFIKASQKEEHFFKPQMASSHALADVRVINRPVYWEVVASLSSKQPTTYTNTTHSQSNILHGHLQFSTSNKQALSSSITTIHVILFPLTRRSRSSLNKQSVLSPSSLRLRNQFSFVPTEP